ncbi:coagulation factor VII [Megalops cyprinoides]|uniref:coagulation factor VII n=1 Tax=Megalops cyprinoides TaxID=118141 RepID=UPI001864DFD8|nr:coagulation factor VII [Megalops cyprinoides]
MSLTGCGTLVAIFLVSVSAPVTTVFLEPREATQILRARKPRANSFLEEMLPGNLERECYEEVCSQEEAAEIFQTKEKTMEFWYRYKNLNPCRYNPCVNGGLCSIDRGDFVCLCPPRYDGKLCEIEVFECEYKNGGCLQYCTSRGHTNGVQCSCAEGYRLQQDGRTCEEAVPFPCGKTYQQTGFRSLLDELLSNETLDFTPSPHNFSHLGGNSTLKEGNSTFKGGNSTYKGDNSTHHGGNHTDDLLDEFQEGADSDTRIVGGFLERQGGSPWQVLIRRKNGYGFCGGTLIAPRWVISAAHCFGETPDHVTIGDYDKMRRDQDEQQIQVKAVILHPHFHAFTFDSDIALIHLAEEVQLGPYATPACLPNPHLAQLLYRDGTLGMVTGWGAMKYLGRSSRFLRKVALPMVDHQNCIRSTEQVVTDNMFCAGYQEKDRDACSGDSGGPYVANYRGIWYLTGVVSWGEECAAHGKYGFYTRVSNYLHWIQDTILKESQNIQT